MDTPHLVRKRLIPYETVHLNEDEVLLVNDEVIVTKWNVLRPRKDFQKGYSCYFYKKGFKISRFLDKEERLVYYYCDIIDTEYLASENTYIFTDLLADVIVYKNGVVKVVDLAEIPVAMDRGLISVELVKKTLKQLDDLLEIIYAGKMLDLISEYITV